MTCCLAFSLWFDSRADLFVFLDKARKLFQKLIRDSVAYADSLFEGWPKEEEEEEKEKEDGDGDESDEEEKEEETIIQIT
jgi:hypothetical protein